jgi:hypothetical protein
MLSSILRARRTDRRILIPHRAFHIVVCAETNVVGLIAPFAKKNSGGGIARRQLAVLIIAGL